MIGLALTYAVEVLTMLALVAAPLVAHNRALEDPSRPADGCDDGR